MLLDFNSLHLNKKGISELAEISVLLWRLPLFVNLAVIRVLTSLDVDRISSFASAHAKDRQQRPSLGTTPVDNRHYAIHKKPGDDVWFAKLPYVSRKFRRVFRHSPKIASGRDYPMLL